jgi:outer membrane protein
MKKTLYLLTICITLFSYNSNAQQKAPLAYSLADCIKYAYEHQDSVKNAELDVKNAEYKVKETIGSGLPQVNGSISFQDYLKVPAQVGPNVFATDPVTGKPIPPDLEAPLVKFPFGPTVYSNTFALQASQLLFSGTFIVGLQAVKTFKELYQRNLTRSKIETNVNVTKAYYQVLVSSEQVKLLDINIKQLKEQVDQTTASNKQGFVEKIDVDRITVQYNNLVTNRENVARAIDLYLQMLKFQMGMPVGTEITLTDKLESIKLDHQAANVIDTTFYHNRIEYNLLETNLKLNQLDVKDKKAAYLPVVVLNGGYGGSFLENHFKYLYDNFYTNGFIGLSINIPIFSGFQRSYQLKQSRINVIKAQNDLANAKNGFALQANAARITFYNSIQSLNNQKRNQELANEVLRVSKIKYQQGVGSSIEVTQAQAALETADNQYIQSLYDAVINKVNLDKAYGKIN